MSKIGYITFIALITLNAPLLGMNALRKKQEKVSAEQALQSFKVVGENDPIYLELEHVSNLPGETISHPTLKSLTALIKKHLVPNEEIQVKKEDSSLAAYDKNNKPIFFLNISTKENIEKLNALQNELGSTMFSNNKLPTIVLPIMCFVCKYDKYQNPPTQLYTIEVTALPPGESVHSIIVNKNDAKLIRNCAEKVGLALGLFHVKFMDYGNNASYEQWKTKTLGRFYMRDVFFNQQDSRIYFINYRKIKQDNPTVDLNYLNARALGAIKEFANYQEGQAVNEGENYLNFVVYFVRGYLSAYPPDKRKDMVLFLKKILLDALSQNLLEQQKNLPNEKVMDFTNRFIKELNAVFQQH